MSSKYQTNRKKEEQERNRSTSVLHCSSLLLLLILPAKQDTLNWWGRARFLYTLGPSGPPVVRAKIFNQAPGPIRELLWLRPTMWRRVNGWTQKRPRRALGPCMLPRGRVWPFWGFQIKHGPHPKSAPCQKTEHKSCAKEHVHVHERPVGCWLWLALIGGTSRSAKILSFWATDWPLCGCWDQACQSTFESRGAPNKKDWGAGDGDCGGLRAAVGACWARAERLLNRIESACAGLIDPEHLAWPLGAVWMCLGCQWLPLGHPEQPRTVDPPPSRQDTLADCFCQRHAI